MSGAKSPDSWTQVTRDDVARYARVSPAVVSYVVNDGPRSVAAATRQRVLDAIAILGYRPNSFARALKMGSTQTLGLVVPDVSNPVFAEIALALEAEAHAQGYALILTNSESDKVLEREQLHLLVARRVDGIVLASSSGEPDLSELIAMRVPAIMLNSIDELHRVQSVGVDLYGGAKMGVEHLIGHGHASIACVLGDNGQRGALERERGWLDALRAAKLKEGPSVAVKFTREGGYEAGKRLLRSVAAPTAIFVSSDQQAIGVLRALHEAQVRIPEDIAVLSFDGSHESEYSWPPLSVVKQPILEMSKSVIGRLITGPLLGDLDHVYFPGELITRQSCGCNVAREHIGGPVLFPEQ